MRIVGTPWHVPHQYHLAQLPFLDEYVMLVTPWRSWNLRARPLPRTITLTDRLTGEFDAAILHIDHDTPYSWPKQSIFNAMARLTQDVPRRVLINHGMPVDGPVSAAEQVAAVQGLIATMPGSRPVLVANSAEAASAWGARHIEHAYPPGEFQSAPLRQRYPRAISFCSRTGMDQVYQRHRLELLRSHLQADGLDFCWIGLDQAPSCYDEYRKLLSESLLYVHLSDHSPMPRARTEAALSGCAVATVRGHGSDRIGNTALLIADGDDHDEVVRLVRAALLDPKQTFKRGQSARDNLAELRGVSAWNRYTEVWYNLLS